MPTLLAGVINSLKLQESLLLPHPVKRTKRSRGVSVNTKIVDIACGSYASYAVDEAGKTWAWGLNNYGQIGLLGQVRCHTSYWCAVHTAVPIHVDTYTNICCLCTDMTWVTLQASPMQCYKPFLRYLTDFCFVFLYLRCSLNLDVDGAGACNGPSRCPESEGL